MFKGKSIMKKKVTIAGSFIVDLMARTPHLPKPGETVKGLTFKMGPGGKGSNQAIAAKRANCDVVFISKVGKDEFGEMALNTFKNEGLDTKYIFEDETLQTGTALIIVDDVTSQNEIVVTSGACDNITKEDLETCKDAIKNCDIFFHDHFSAHNISHRYFQCGKLNICREKIYIFLVM